MRLGRDAGCRVERRVTEPVATPRGHVGHRHVPGLICAGAVLAAGCVRGIWIQGLGPLRILHIWVMSSAPRRGFNWPMALRAPEPTSETATPARKGFTRRQALAAAVATGVSVGAVRLLGGTIQNITRSSKATGADWVSPLSRES